MEEKTLNLLLEEVNDNVESLKNYKKGSNEYGSIVVDTGTLMDKATNMMKIRNEAEQKAKDRAEKKAERADDKAEKKKDRIIEVGKIAVPVLTTAALILHDDRVAKQLLKFEETGCLSTSWSRSFFGKILKRGK